MTPIAMKTPVRTAIAPSLTWSGLSFESGQIAWLDANGELESVEPLNPAEAKIKLDHEALLPGFFNAHSHAFQIGLRGHGESYPVGQGSFWTWREAMYDLVSEMTADRLYELSKRAFEEMLAAGITCVGEFHYLRHLSDGLDFEGDDVVLAAADDAGIRIVLLAVYYATGGIHQPLGPAQKRFATPDLATYWKQMERLANRLRSPLQTLGVAPHSIRAVPRADLKELHAEAKRQGLPVHMHVEEQRKEIEECVAAYEATPMEILLNDLGDLENFTAVHCTHTPADQLGRFFAAGGRACICPLTEANLGDGLPNLAEVSDAVDHLCLGTDSNFRISMLEEMRWLEYGQRVRREERGSIAGESGCQLVRVATEGGRKALADRWETPLRTAPLLVPADRVRESTWVYSLSEGAIRPHRGLLDGA